MSKIKVDDWTGCYPSKWKGIIVDDAMRHPAKFSSRLIRRIYEHMITEGWLKPGDMVIDPFGGVALGALDAMRSGIAWRGVELEARFAELGNQNIASWNARFSNMPHWNPDALLLQGDSRNLLQILGDAGHRTAVTSPPYAEGLGHNMRKVREIDQQKSLYMASGSLAYGESDGQLGQMKATEEGHHKAVISSPPYAEITIGEFTVSRENFVAWIKNELATKGYIEFKGKKYTENEWRALNYGRLDGRVMKGAPKMGTGGYEEAAAAISSPPYAESMGNAEQSGIDWGKQADRETDHPHGWNGAGYSQAAISSPPYSDSEDGSTPGQLGAMKGNGFEAAISSPPFQAAQTGGGIAKIGYSNEEMRKGSGEQPFDLVGKRAYMPENQGTHIGNLANMPAGDFNAAITSPPFRQASGGTPEPKEGGTIDDALYARHAAGNSAAGAYGEEEGQLANMPDGDFDAAVTSPPYLPKDDQKVPWGATVGKSLEDMDEERGFKRDESFRGYYSLDPANLGNPTGADQTDFWAAARTIIEQVYLALAQGGHAVWVLKAFVRNKEIVDFPDQWRQLCEVVGFVSLHEHHALLVRHTGTSLTLEEGKVEHKTESKSFFRRLAEKNGSPRIDYEVVLCQERPA